MQCALSLMQQLTGKFLASRALVYIMIIVTRGEFLTGRALVL